MALAGEKTDFSVCKVSEFILLDPLAKKDFLHWVSDYVIAAERLGQGEGYLSRRLTSTQPRGRGRRG